MFCLHYVLLLFVHIKLEKLKQIFCYYLVAVSRVAIFYYVSMEKLLENDIFKLKQLKRWIGEDTILAMRVWPNVNYGSQYL